MPARYTLGLNQYTHSAACCILDPEGEPVVALEKERVTRKKHDGGDVAVLVEAALEAAGLRLRDLGLVVANNHLFRIAPFHEVLPWQVALHQWRPSYLDRHNLLPGVRHHELSHHLAHAWSVLTLCPFDEGLIVVMDGMGSRRRDALHRGPGYTGDGDLPRDPAFEEWPRPLDPTAEDWREAETVYAFRGLELRLLRKRWGALRQPDFLHNYGFEDMEGLGAVYSRVASHIFGDWNTCGKVMGLAPWAGRWLRDGAGKGGGEDWLLRGPLERLRVNHTRLRREPHANAWGRPGTRAAHVRLARDVQRDLEAVVLPFLRRLRRRTGLRRLCLTGGVALNSVLNGRIARECGFDEVFVPPWPGDDGIAVGCALFGHHRLRRRRARPRRHPFGPFLGRSFPGPAVARAVAAHTPWVRELPPPKTGAGEEDPVLAAAADALARGAVVGWFQGRGELGPRALGNRCILAHPGRRATWREVNRRKGREAFRPLAPVVLAEHARELFPGAPPSPWMSFTAPVAPAWERRLRAVLHVDGSARLQTLRREDNPRFHALLRAFHARTGLPALLNTSFNRAGEPLVDAPEDAIRCFLDAGLDLLVLEDRLLEPRPFPGPAEHTLLVPVHEATWTASVQSDSKGEPLQVLLMAGGRTWESDPLELGLLEHCDGERSLAQLVALFANEFEEPPAATLPRLERLWRRRLLALREGPGQEGGPGPAILEEGPAGA